MNALRQFLHKWMALPSVASAEGKQVDQLLVYFHLLMVPLFAGWSICFLYALWRFRASKNPKPDYAGAKTHASTWLKVGVACVEMLLLFGIAVPFWARAVEQFPPENQSTVIRVIAREFNWTARYPGPDGQFGEQDPKLVSPSNPFGLLAEDPNLRASDPAGLDDVLGPANEMVVPVNKPVIIYLSSLDVIHSFKIVPLRVTQDAIPGMSIPLHFTPTRLGSYEIQCSQFCGDGHSTMRGIFKVVSQSEYQAWLKACANSALAK